MLELVAPAGDMDSLRLAIAHGADAVYLGLKAFSARAYAANFDPGDLEKLVRLAHLRRVRVYITMNTLLRQDELEAALEQARLVHELGVDAVIVQDLGFLSRLREVLPGLRLHASTQMTAVNAVTLQVLAERGVSRVVLARESSEEEVHALAMVGPEIEVFAHGALCYSYSGQCLMSSIIGGRSGNRGRCAQPCRLEYALMDAEGRQIGCDLGGYLLSPKDLCLLPYLDRLEKAGVKALKIEGRMKRPEYVGTVVRIYRQALNRLAERPENYKAGSEELRELEQAFNRGFTPGFFLGGHGFPFLSSRRPNNRGIPLGRVTAMDRDAGLISFTLTEDLKRGDGLEVWVTKGGRVGFIVETMWLHGKETSYAERGQTVGIPLREAVYPGDRVFRTSDAELNARAMEPLTSGEGLYLTFWAQARLAVGEPMRLTLTDDEGRSVTVQGETAGQPALNRPLSAEIIREHLGRTGGTVWRPAEIEVDLQPGMMLPLSELNRIRRAGLAALEEKRLGDLTPAPLYGGRGERGNARAYVGVQYIAPDNPTPGAYMAPKIAVTIGDPEEARAAIVAGADRLYLASWLHPWPDEVLAGLLVEAQSKETVLVYALPRVAPEREMEHWRLEMRRVQGNGLHGLRVGDLGLAKAAGSSWRGHIYFDHSLNVMNAATLSTLADLAIKTALSPELTLTQARLLSQSLPGTAEILAHGRLEMMLSAHCLLGAVDGGKNEPGQPCSKPCQAGGYTLRDRKDMSFPLVGDRFCRLHVLNSVDLSILPELGKFAGCGFDLRLELQGRGAEYVTAVVSTYKQCLDTIAKGAWSRGDGEKAEAALKRYSPEGFTRGHYFRGVE